MQKKHLKAMLSLLVCVTLIAAIALTITGCKSNTPPSSTVEKTFTLSITDGNGKTTVTTVTSDKQTVGEALEEKGIIQGEEGPFGLYIKTVGGITADYDKDKSYWAFYVNGDYAVQGADKTDIVEGTTYGFKIEK